MIQRRQHLGLALEVRHPFRVAGEDVRQDLERHLTLQRARYTYPMPPPPSGERIS
jgi:hypothetical protein